MIAVFNKKGITKEQLNSYGNLPRVGSQTFQIFAYFDGIDISNYGSAYIKLYRPDYKGSAYPILFMTKADLTFHSSSGVTSNYLHNGQTYPGFIFDFAKIKDTKGTSSLSDDVIVTLLDTPGEWKAVITLVSTGEVSNVVGSISFNVSGIPAEDDEETEIGLDVVISTMADIVADKLDRESVYYVREISNFEAKAAAGQLPQTIFVEGSIVFDEINNSFYKINTVSENVSEAGHVYCSSYTKLIDPVPYTGANKDVDLGSHDFGARNVVTFGYIQAKGGVVIGNINSPNVIIFNSSSEGGKSTTIQPGTTTSHIILTLPNTAGTFATQEWADAQYAKTIEVGADGNVPYRYNFSLKNDDGTVISTTYVDLASESVQADLESYVNTQLASYLPLSAGSTKPLTGSLYFGTNEANFNASDGTNASGAGFVKGFYDSTLAKRGLKFSANGEIYMFVGDDGNVIVSAENVPDDIVLYFPTAGGTFATQEWCHLYQHNIDIHSSTTYIRFNLTDRNSDNYGRLNIGNRGILQGLANAGYDGSGLSDYPNESLTKVLLANGYISSTGKRIIGVFKTSSDQLGIVFEDGTDGLLDIITYDTYIVRDFVQQLR